MGISNNYWRDYWSNIGLNIKLLYQGKIVELEKLKYMKEINEKPSICSYTGIEDYQTMKSYTPIRVYSEY